MCLATQKPLLWMKIFKSSGTALQVTAKQARKHAEKYSWNACTDQFLQNLVRRASPIYTFNFWFFQNTDLCSELASNPCALLDWTAYLLRRFQKNSAKGYGFITPDNGSDDCFVHVTAVQASGYKQLLENQRVEFEMQEGRNGRMVAGNLTMLDDATGDAAGEAAE